MTSLIRGIDYPDNDGNPIAENTLQFEWIVTIKGGVDTLFQDQEDVFVAGDLLWYPVEGDPKTRAAPDIMVAFGRPKGYRGSYKTWDEGGIQPQVVFEVLSPGNRPDEMLAKFRFYERFGVEEYYLYDPDGIRLSGWIRRGASLETIEAINGWTSPRLGVQFRLAEDELIIVGPDGRRFLTYGELFRAREQAEREREQEKRERERAEREIELAKEERARIIERQAKLTRQFEELAAKLRSLGLDPETLDVP